MTATSVFCPTGPVSGLDPRLHHGSMTLGRTGPGDHVTESQPASPGPWSSDAGLPLTGEPGTVTALEGSTSCVSDRCVRKPRLRRTRSAVLRTMSNRLTGRNRTRNTCRRHSHNPLGSAEQHQQSAAGLLEERCADPAATCASYLRRHQPSVELAWPGATTRGFSGGRRFGRFADITLWIPAIE